MRHLALTLALFAFPMLSHAIEEPDFEVLRRVGDVEVRQYAPYIVAEVFIPGPADGAVSDAGNAAFPILAGYIFGKNKGARTFAMTAPVTQTPVPVRLPMTAPVTQSAAAGGHLVQFVLPKGLALADAPEPVDERVRLREVPARRLAAITYSGFWSVANDREHLDKLTDALRAANLAWTGEPVYSRYNAPFTPWFLRRNEIWLTLTP
ncbi:heme-binding protein [Ideonella sp. A 288]|uniref:SOUL family heme-binding protein n=1 Tax=Ideonella sp. A 288 TaxID=1962181 RepID=UPI0018FE5589|nr:heme-binding protein [Ideonella sp. A 288]